ncbi:MAG: tetratricopeptide repeat protein [Bdellovibrio sp.]|nr:tetratricopeptide repeat protein [Bdellovibrio sp.]
MHPHLKATASATLLFILSACGSLPTKEQTASLDMKTINAPTAANAPLNVRSEADYRFIMADVASLEGKPAKAIDLFEKVLKLDQASPVVHMRLSEEYYKANKMKEAIFHAEQTVQKDSKNVAAHVYLGGLYSAEKMNDKAIAQYDIVLKQDPVNTEVPIYLGSLYAAKKDYKKSEQYFTSLLKNHNFSTPHVAHYYLGLTRLAQGGKQQQLAAENAFKKSLSLKPDYDDAAISLANLYLQKNERNKALTLCLNFQRQNRFNPKVADFIAQTYLENDESDKAYQQLDYIATHSDSSEDTRIRMALLLIKQKRYNLATSKLQEIVAKNPKSDTARYYLAAVFEETGFAEDAIHEYLQIPATSNHFSEATVHAAYLLKGMGKLNQALDISKKSLSAKANEPQVYTMYASLLDAKRDYLGAARILEEGLSKFAGDTGLMFQHAVALDRLGKKDVMISQMKKILELEPDHVQSMNYLAFTLAELNQQLPEAEKLARRAYALQPQDGYVLDTLGWVLFKQKKFPESIALLEKAFSYQSQASIIAEHLADAYSMHSMPKEAKEMYNKAVNLTKDQHRANQIQLKISKLVL